MILFGCSKKLVCRVGVSRLVRLEIDQVFTDDYRGEALQGLNSAIRYQYISRAAVSRFNIMSGSCKGFVIASWAG